MKELKFIHITKTAGTSIENLAQENNINWGRFDLEYKNCSKMVNSWWHHVIPLKNKYDWFMVVRNPYDRIVSEFYCPYDTIDKTNYSKEQFNSYIQEKLKQIKIKDYDHYRPQYLYLNNNVKIHILKFENLTEEFNNLMKEYNLKIELECHDNKGKDKKFTVNDLNTETIKLINSVYDKDFANFSYLTKDN